MHSSKLSISVGVIIIATIALAYYLFTQKDTQANVDYICTREVQTEGQCSNGEWSQWELSNTNEEGSQTWKRVYSGFRTLSTVIEYANLRTSCGEGFTQRASGQSNGSSGFHGGDTTVYGTACQIEESFATVVPDPGVDPTADPEGSLSGVNSDFDPNAPDFNPDNADSYTFVDEKIEDLGDKIVIDKDEITQEDIDNITINAEMECSLDGANYKTCSDGFVAQVPPEVLHVRIPDGTLEEYHITSTAWSLPDMDTIDPSNLSFGILHGSVIEEQGTVQDNNSISLIFGEGKEFGITVEFVGQANRNILGKTQIARATVTELVPIRVINVEIIEE